MATQLTLIPYSSYMKLYGQKFSKQDHVKFVQALVHIITIPHLDPTKLNKCCVCLSHLLRYIVLGRQIIVCTSVDGHVFFFVENQLYCHRMICKSIGVRFMDSQRFTSISAAPKAI